MKNNNQKAMKLLLVVAESTNVPIYAIETNAPMEQAQEGIDNMRPLWEYENDITFERCEPTLDDVLERNFMFLKEEYYVRTVQLERMPDGVIYRR